MKNFLDSICPPIILNSFIKLKKIISPNKSTNQDKIIIDSSKQDLEMYWDPEYADVLEVWGTDNTWNEIQLLLSPCKGKVLDIACGTGITIEILRQFSQLELYGFDISDLLIKRAIQKNIPKERLKVADATKENYKENEFDYSYSIGSLEHFTLDGISDFIKQSSRVTKKIAFHMIPVSKSNNDEGWMKTVQSFFNNSEEWWMKKFQEHHTKVYSIPSKWEDAISNGRWFVCINEI